MQKELRVLPVRIKTNYDTEVKTKIKESLIIFTVDVSVVKV